MLIQNIISYGTPFAAGLDFDAVTLLKSTSGNTWTVPAGVTSINILGIAGGGSGSLGSSSNETVGRGGAGGALIYANDIPVSPGDTIYFKVGAGGARVTTTSGAGSDGGNTVVRMTNEAGDLIFDAHGGKGAPIAAAGRSNGGARTNGAISGVTYGGGNGGDGGYYSGYISGGGGAAGYSGNGGQGHATATAGSGGGGGGSGSHYNNTDDYYFNMVGGGGTGAYGEGASGAAGSGNGWTIDFAAACGGGGSGGGKSWSDRYYRFDIGKIAVSGNLFGSGGGGCGMYNPYSGDGGDGVIVITYGTDSQYPTPSFPVKANSYTLSSNTGTGKVAVMYAANGKILLSTDETNWTYDDDWLISGDSTDYEIKYTPDVEINITGNRYGGLSPNTYYSFANDRIFGCHTTGGIKGTREQHIIHKVGGDANNILSVTQAVLMVS